MQQLASAFLNVVLFGGMFISTFLGGVMTGATYIKIAEEAPGIGAQVAAIAMSTIPPEVTKAKAFPADKVMPTKEMKERMGTSTPGVKAMGVPACVQLVLKATLGRGSQGEDVSRLQKRLIEEGYMATTSDLGFFGARTEKALAHWQMKQGLASSSEPNPREGIGRLGPRTRALFEKCENRIEHRKDVLMEKREGMPMSSTTPDSKKKVVDPTTSSGSNKSETSVQILSPNGGEQFHAGIGDTLTINWNATNVPSGSRACVLLQSLSTGKLFTFPPSGGCSDVQSGAGSVSGPLILNSGYKLVPDSYKAVVMIQAAAEGNGKEGRMLAKDYSDAPFILDDEELGGSPVSNVASVIDAIGEMFKMYGNR